MQSQDEIAIACTGCGYDLRGLPADGNCPECGGPIARSLAGDRLVHADIRWLTSIAGGARWLSRGVGMIMTAAGLALITTFVLTCIGLADVPLPSWSFQLVAIMLGLTVCVGLITALIGNFRVSAKDPRETDTEPWHSRRNRARWGLIVFVTSTIAAAGLVWINSPSRAIASMAVIIIFVMLGSAVIAVHALLHMLGDLADRVPSSSLADDTRRVARFMAWGLPVLIFGVIVPANFPGAFSAFGGPCAGLFGCGYVILFFVMIAQLVILAVLLRDHARAYDECLQLARTRETLRAIESRAWAAAHLEIPVNESIPEQASGHQPK